MNSRNMASFIDHTLLKAHAKKEEITLLCYEAMHYDFATVAVHPVHISCANKCLQGSDVGITAALAYPFGSWSSEMKAFEIQNAVDEGATDCDYVINIYALKSGNIDLLKREAAVCRKAAGSAVLKAILEVCLLTEEEIRAACSVYGEAGCDFIKTSTGYREPPLPETIELMAECVSGTSVLVKAAGGIRTAEDAEAMIQAGASRLGTSAGISILEGRKN